MFWLAKTVSGEWFTIGGHRADRMKNKFFSWRAHAMNRRIFLLITVFLNTWNSPTLAHVSQSGPSFSDQCGTGWDRSWGSQELSEIKCFQTFYSFESCNDHHDWMLHVKCFVKSHPKRREKISNLYFGKPFYSSQSRKVHFRDKPHCTAYSRVRPSPRAYPISYPRWWRNRIDRASATTRGYCNWSCNRCIDIRI